MRTRISQLQLSSALLHTTSPVVIRQAPPLSHFFAPVCPSRCSQRSVVVTTRIRSHMPTAVFHEAPNLRQCCSDGFVHCDWSEVCNWETDVKAVLSAARYAAPVLHCLFRPRASDCLKCTSNEGQHEVNGFLPAPHSQHACFHDDCPGRFVCASQAHDPAVMFAINGSATKW